MSPNRRFTDYRSYLTETVYDADRGEFTENPYPLPDGRWRTLSPSPRAGKGALAARRFPPALL